MHKILKRGGYLIVTEPLRLINDFGKKCDLGAFNMMETMYTLTHSTKFKMLTFTTLGIIVATAVITDKGAVVINIHYIIGNDKAFSVMVIVPLDKYISSVTTIF